MPLDAKGDRRLADVIGNAVKAVRMTSEQRVGQCSGEETCVASERYAVADRLLLLNRQAPLRSVVR